MGVFGRKTHQAPGKSSQNKHTESKFLTFPASTSPPGMQRHAIPPSSPRGGRARAEGMALGLGSSWYVLQVRTSGEALQSPPDRD